MPIRPENKSLDGCTAFELIGNRSSASVSRAGCRFDPDDPIWQAADEPRYATWIQQARDDKNFGRADEVRSMALSFGAIVELGKDHTAIFQGDQDDFAALMPHAPSWSGYSEWVTPDNVRGRHILEYCRHPLHALSQRLDGMTAKEKPRSAVHSIKVANWRDHPNLEAARAMGLPVALWTAEGQATLEASHDIYWAFQQMDAVEAARARLGRASVKARLLADLF
jgi:hypothetical protein